MKKIAFIGAGNMASAIIRGLILSGYDEDMIMASDCDLNKLTQLQNELHINITQDNSSAISYADMVMLAVKPQMISQVLAPLKQSFQAQQPIVISMAAGITLLQLQQFIGSEIPIVCVMPNLPAKIGKGMTGLFSSRLNVDDIKAVDDIFNLIGKTIWLKDESLMRAVSSLSGSGPAIIYYIIEALREAGEKLGLSPSDANVLSQQMILGSVLMADADQNDVSILRKQVTSPKGTTEQAIAVFEKGNLKNLMFEALNAAVERSKELTKENEVK